MFAILLPAMIGFVAIAVEVGYWYLLQEQLQAAADAGAMAGAALANSGNTSYAPTAASTTITDNVPFLGAGEITTNNVDSDGFSYDITINHQVIPFMNLGSGGPLTITTSASATVLPLGTPACALSLVGPVIINDALTPPAGCYVASNATGAGSIVINASAQYWPNIPNAGNGGSTGGFQMFTGTWSAGGCRNCTSPGWQPSSNSSGSDAWTPFSVANSASTNTLTNAVQFFATYQIPIYNALGSLASGTASQVPPYYNPSPATINWPTVASNTSYPALQNYQTGSRYQIDGAVNLPKGGLAADLALLNCAGFHALIPAVGIGFAPNTPVGAASPSAAPAASIPLSTDPNLSAHPTNPDGTAWAGDLGWSSTAGGPPDGGTWYACSAPAASSGLGTIELNRDVALIPGTYFIYKANLKIDAGVTVQCWDNFPSSGTTWASTNIASGASLNAYPSALVAPQPPTWDANGSGPGNYIDSGTSIVASTDNQGNPLSLGNYYAIPCIWITNANSNNNDQDFADDGYTKASASTIPANPAQPTTFAYSSAQTACAASPIGNPPNAAADEISSYGVTIIMLGGGTITVDPGAMVLLSAPCINDLGAGYLDAKGNTVGDPSYLALNYVLFYAPESAAGDYTPPSDTTTFSDVFGDYDKSSSCSEQITTNTPNACAQQSVFAGTIYMPFRNVEFDSNILNSLSYINWYCSVPIASTLKLGADGTGTSGGYYPVQLIGPNSWTLGPVTTDCPTAAIPYVALSR